MDMIAQIEAEQIASLSKEIPDFKAGDTVKVGYKVTEGTRSRVQNYEGVCIARKNGVGIAGSFTVRKISFGEGVERTFALYSSIVDSIKVIRSGKVRKAKLYYLRDRTGKSARIAEKIKKKIGIEIDTKPEQVTEENVVPPVVEKATTEAPKAEVPKTEAPKAEEKKESSKKKK